MGIGEILWRFLDDERTLVQGLSGRAFGARVGAARAGLARRGVGPGDRVVWVAGNSADWLAVDLAVIALGAVGVPLYERLGADELAALARDCGAAVVLRADEFPGLFAEAGPLGTPAPRAPGDAVTLVYTSGTSGEPKGAVLTDAGLAFVVEAASRALDGAVGGRDDHVLHYLPLCFAGSRIVAWTCLARGVPLTLLADPAALLDRLPEVAPTWFLNVPLVLERVRRGVEASLAARPAPVRWLVARALRDGPQRGVSRALADRLVFAKVRARLGGRARFLICGSAALSPATQRWFSAIGLPVLQVYGLTETTAIVTVDDPRDVVPGTVGRPLPGVEVRLVDDELQVRGPVVFGGYWGRPEATAAALDDGWLRTGDRCTLDATGRITVVARVRDLLVPTTGHNVAPEPLEALLEAVPGVEQAIVVGHARPHLVALVAGDASRVDLDALNADLPPYRRIRRLVPIPLQTPENGGLTANRKLRRGVIAERFAAAIDAAYRA